MLLFPIIRETDKLRLLCQSGIYTLRNLVPQNLYIIGHFTHLQMALDKAVLNAKYALAAQMKSNISGLINLS